MKKSVSLNLTKLFFLLFVFLCSPAIAGEWQPLCIEGSSCKNPYEVDMIGRGYGHPVIGPYLVGPLVTADGIYLHHSPPHLDELDRHVFHLSTEGLKDFGDRLGLVSDINAIQVPGGRTFSLWLGGGLAWFFPADDTETISWTNDELFFLGHLMMIGPPVIVGNVIFIGSVGYGATYVWSSTDDGISWSSIPFWFNVDGDRFNLLESPEKDALWVIESDYQDSSGGLWELVDDSVPWTQIDDGSFPADTVRVVHDPDDSMVSYALTKGGLYVSIDHGFSWQSTTMTEPVHGMVFVKRNLGLSRALIVGIDTGVSVSVDEASSWVNMGNGLPEIPHTVTYGHGQLIATSDAGYFTCNAIDCAGLATAVEIGATEIEVTNNFRFGAYISWKPVDYATVYRVFRCLDDNVKSCGLPIGFVYDERRVTRFSDSKATPGDIYHYRVRACIKNRCGGFSESDIGFKRLIPPTDIKASDGTFNDRIRISWKPVDGATFYRVIRCVDNEVSSCEWPLSFPRVTFFDDTKAVSDTVYHYRVRACTTDMCSGLSLANTGFIN